MNKQGGYGVSYLDDEVCFMLWAELGTLDKTMYELERRGLVNPKTGNPPTRRAIQVASKRYIMGNLKESYTVYRKLGSLLSWEEYLRWAVHYIKKDVSRDKYRRWLKKEGLMKYDPEYASTFETLESVYEDPEIQEIKEIYERLST